jgi:hypothetical protein
MGHQGDSALLAGGDGADGAETAIAELAVRLSAGPAEVLVGLTEIRRPEAGEPSLDLFHRHAVQGAAVDLLEIGAEAQWTQTGLGQSRRRGPGTPERAGIDGREPRLPAKPLPEELDLSQTPAAQRQVGPALQNHGGFISPVGGGVCVADEYQSDRLLLPSPARRVPRPRRPQRCS